jgi:hypothetical protein
MRLGQTGRVKVLIDLSVWLHFMESELESSLGEFNESFLQGQFNWLMSLEWLEGVVYDVAEADPIICMDCPYKEYWRTEWLKQPHITEALPPARKATKKRQAVPAGEIVYKGGRRFPTPLFKKTKAYIIELVKASGFPVLQRRGYEADDMIAASVKLNSSKERPDELLIVTTDTDLLGLVNEYTGWYCLYGYKPRVRFNVDDVNVWCGYKKFPAVSEASELWRNKSKLFGDPSDKIPACESMATLPAIDLLNPPEQYRVWDSSYAEVIKDALSYQSQTKPNGLAVERVMKSYGVPLCPSRFQPYTTNKLTPVSKDVTIE